MDLLLRLHEVPFFLTLRHSQLRALAHVCKYETYIAGESIIHQGDLTTRFFIVDEGHVHFRETDHEGLEHPVGSAAPGQYFGLKMFTTQEPSPYTADPLGQASLYVLDREDFDRLVEARPDILTSLPEIVKERRRLNRGFTWLAPGELVAMTTHRHGVTIIAAIIMPVLVGIVLIGASIGASYFGFFSDSLQMIMWAGLAVLLLVWISYAIGEWADDDFIVTNKRVAHVDRRLVFLPTRDEIPINKIQSLTASQGGPLDILLGVGSLTITSAGGGGTQIVFDRIKNPKSIEELILQQQALLRAREQAIERERFRRHLGTELRHYVLKQRVTETVEEPETEVDDDMDLAIRAHRRPIAGLWHYLFGYEFRRGDTVTWRKHWIGLLGHMRLRLIPLLASFFLATGFLWLPMPSPVTDGGFLLVVLTLFVVGLADFLWGWEDWRNDLYQVTDRLVVDIERWPFGINERQKVALLTNVQDVSVKRPQLLNSLLNYGDVQINVAGSGEPLVFHVVAHPDDIAAEIFRRLDASRIRKIQRETSAQSREIVDALVAYNRLLVAQRHEPGEENGGTPVNNGQGTGALPDGGPPALESGPETLSPQAPRVEPVGSDTLAEFPPPEEAEAADLYEDNL